MNKLEYLLSSALRIFSEKKCPYCKIGNHVVIDRKYIVTSLLHCNNCGLYYRHPKDSIKFNKLFYQRNYRETDITRNIPYSNLLEDYKRNNFAGSGKDYHDKVDVFNALFSGEHAEKIKIVDYGASWGYASFQFRNAGFDIQCFEISESMAKAGKDLLGVNICTTVSALQPSNDIFFSAHVIEHMPDINILFEDAKRLLKKGGYFICYCPNGSVDFRKKHPVEFHKRWGLVHPNFLNNIFFEKTLATYPYLIASDNKGLINEINAWDKASQITAGMEGDELIVIAKISN